MPIQVTPARDPRAPEPIPRLERALRTSARLGEERSIVDLVLLACDFSDDPQEIGELVAALVDETSTRLLCLERDPMLRCRPAARHFAAAGAT